MSCCNPQGDPCQRVELFGDGSHPYDAGYELGTYGADTLYTSTLVVGFEDSSKSGQRWRGLDIDASSHYRALLCFFDNDSVGVPLVVGHPIRRSFQRVRVQPFAQWTNRPNAVAGLPASSDAAPVLFAGQLVLRYWRRPPESQADPRLVQVSRVLSIGANASQSNKEFMALHCPGAKRLLFWAHNNGVNNANQVDVSLWSLNPERPPSATLVLEPADRPADWEHPRRAERRHAAAPARHHRRPGRGRVPDPLLVHRVGLGRRLHRRCRPDRLLRGVTMNPLFVAAGLLVLLLLRSSRDAGGIRVPMLEVTPYLEDGKPAAGDAWYIPASTPRTRVTQPIPYADPAPGGWGLYQLQLTASTRFYTSAGDGLYVYAGDFGPGDAVFVRDAIGDDGPVPTTQDPAQQFGADFPFEHLDL